MEHHTAVSVLYADVVNYTYMTTQLPVKVLVETLHELFVKFDQASEVRKDHRMFQKSYITNTQYLGIQCAKNQIFG